MLTQKRKKIIESLFSDYASTSYPIDVFLSKYFRKNRYIGSKDRRCIADFSYALMRWKGLVDYFINKPVNWEKRIELFNEIQPNITQMIKDDALPLSAKVSFPKEYIETLLKSYSEKEVLAFCLTSNTQAPISIRANTYKITRDELFEQLVKKYPVKKSSKNPDAIIFEKRVNFFTLEEFKAGFFEVQDEGSQQLCSYIQVRPKNLILDYCAGSGGKSLAIAPQLNKTGQLFLHDIRTPILLEAKKRFKRAGITNVQFVTSEKQKKALQKKIDVLLLDVPCSGSGTLRRNPDMKWRFSKENLKALIQTQRSIFAESLSYINANSIIYYMTCSVFKEENEEQIAYFCKQYDLKLLFSKSWLPVENGKDGFFIAALKK